MGGMAADSVVKASSVSLAAHSGDLQEPARELNLGFQYKCKKN
jgi:hypothetical protein